MKRQNCTADEVAKYREIRRKVKNRRAAKKRQKKRPDHIRDLKEEIAFLRKRLENLDRLKEERDSAQREMEKEEADLISKFLNHL